MPKFTEQVGVKGSNRGGWLASLADEVSKAEGLNLSIIFPWSGSSASPIVVDNVLHIPIPISAENFSKEMRIQTSDETLAKMATAISNTRPDVVHVHGCEYFMGLVGVRGGIKCPWAVSIQGVLNEYAPHFMGGLNKREIRDCHNLYDLIKKSGPRFEFSRFEKFLPQEREILEGTPNFIGRTEWDRSVGLKYSKNAGYFHGDEMLRPPFFEKQWRSSQLDSHVVFASASSYPLKGLHWLLRAMAVVIKQYPDATLRVADVPFMNKSRLRKGYAGFLRNLSLELGIEKSLVCLGDLNGEQMANELSNAAVFAMPSLIENSANSLCEAMLIGTPCVATMTGGTPSMINPGQDAIGVPSCDPQALAQGILKIFGDRDLAERLSQNSRERAQARHNPERIVAELLAGYASLSKPGVGV